MTDFKELIKSLQEPQKNDLLWWWPQVYAYKLSLFFFNSFLSILLEIYFVLLVWLCKISIKKLTFSFIMEVLRWTWSNDEHDGCQKHWMNNININIFTCEWNRTDEGNSGNFLNYKIWLVNVVSSRTRLSCQWLIFMFLSEQHSYIFWMFLYVFNRNFYFLFLFVTDVNYLIKLNLSKSKWWHVYCTSY